MLSRRRFLLPLVVGMSLSTLALADSTPVSMASVGSATSVYDASRDYSSHRSINTGAPVITLAGSNSLSTERWTGQPRVPRIGNEMLIENDVATNSTFLGERHGTISYKTGNWAVWHQVSPMSAPESGGLILLSTGFIGIAGIVRRQQRREPART